MISPSLSSPERISKYPSRARCELAGRKGEDRRYQGRVLCGPALAPCPSSDQRHHPDCWLTPERYARHRIARRASSADPACGAGFPHPALRPRGTKLNVELSLVPDNLTAVQMINHILQTFSRARTQQDHHQLTARQLKELLVFAITVAATR